MTEKDEHQRIRRIDEDLDTLAKEMPPPLEGASDVDDPAENVREQQKVEGQIEELEEDRKDIADGS